MPWLRFSVQGRGFALPLHSVAEVAHAATPRLIPLVPRALAGVVAFRGDPLPVVDAAALLEAETGGARRHLVVLAHERLRLGLLVSEVARIERGLEGGAEPAEAQPPEFAKWIRLGGEPVGLIPPDELLNRATKLLTEQRIEGGSMPWHDAF